MSNTGLSEKIEIIERRLLRDERGWLLKTIDGKERGLPNRTGEVYVVCGLPNQIRGGHYHQQATEWFTIIKGEAVLRLKDKQTGEEMTMMLNDQHTKTVVVPPFVAHQFENNGQDEFLLLAYSDLLYDPSDTIRYDL